MIDEDKNLVQSIYPNCQCHHVNNFDGEWFLIYADGVVPNSLKEKPIEYSFVSEEHAWKRAARAILKNMVTKLES